MLRNPKQYQVLDDKSDNKDGHELSFLRRSLSDLQLAQKKETGNQKWRWTKEGYIENFLGSFLECEGAVAGDGSKVGYVLYTSSKDNSSNRRERWRASDDGYIEHIETGLVLDAFGCKKWIQDLDGRWKVEYDNLSLALVEKDPSSQGQKWAYVDHYIQNKSTGLVIEINDTRVEAECFNVHGFEKFKKYVEDGGDVNEEGDFLRGKSGPSRVTRVWQAAYSGNLYLLQELQKLGANLNHIASNRCNALSMVTGATSSAHLEVARYLLKNGGCDPFLTGKGGAWEGFSSFAASIINMPQFALDSLEAKYKTSSAYSNTSKYDFSGIELDENHTSLAKLRAYQGQEGYVQPVELMIHYGRKELIATPVIKKILEIRWETFGQKKFNFNFFVSAVYGTFFVLVALLWPWKLEKEGVPTHCTVLASILFVLTFVHINTEISQFQGIFLDSLFVVGIVLQLVFPVLLIIISINPALQMAPELAGATAIVLSILLPFSLMRLGLVLRQTGPFLVSLNKVLWDVLRVLACFTLPFGGFMVSVYIAYSQTIKVVASPTNMPSMFDFGWVEEINEPLLKVVWQGTYIIFHVAIVTFVAVLIAVVANSFNSLQKNALDEWLIIHAKFLAKLPQSPKQLKRYETALKIAEQSTFDQSSNLPISLDVVNNKLDNLSLAVAKIEASLTADTVSVASI